MKVVVEYQGKRYESKCNADITPAEAVEVLYKNFSNTTKFTMELADGGNLILGERALQSAVILFLP